MNQRLRKIWVCNDVWMDILPFFERPQLGLKLATLSDHFDVLVDAHFDGQTELTIWRRIVIRRDEDAATPIVRLYWSSETFALAQWPLPNKIRFHFLQIEYLDISVIAFLRSNQQIWDRGTNLRLNVRRSSPNIDNNAVETIWDVFVRQIWPIFTTTTATNVQHHLGVDHGADLDTLLRLTSPTILIDLNLTSIQSNGGLFPDAIADDDDDGPNATTCAAAGQALSKWLHVPSTDGRPKKVRCLSSTLYRRQATNLEWITNFKETFLRATTSVSYQVNFGMKSSTPIVLFGLVNERTNEKLTLEAVPRRPGNWVMKRCPIGETAAVQWEDGTLDANLNSVHFIMDIDKQQCIGPLSPPAAAEEAGQSNEKVFSTDESRAN